MIVSNITSILKADIRTIWQAVTSPDDYAWRSDIHRIEVTGTNHFTEYTTGGTATRFTVTACEPCRRYELDMENENISGHWTGIFRENAQGTEVEFTEYITVRKWWMRPFARIYLRMQQQRYLRDLKRRSL